MTVLTEGDLHIHFPRVAKARKFDDDSLHGLSHCMKAVDFIVELPDRVFFIEIKDPDHPKAEKKDKEKFIKNFKSGKIDEDFKYKFRDSFLYEWALDNINKPIYYWIIIAINSLTKADLLIRTGDIQRKLPLNGPASRKWKRQIVAGCAVFNIAAWNRAQPHYQISRNGS